MATPEVASASMVPGDRVRLKDNPSREGTLSSHPAIGEGRRRKLVVEFAGGPEAVLALQLEKVEQEVLDPYLLMSRGSYGAAKHLRGAVTFCRLSGKLANLIYSLNTTNTQFLPYQFKPVLQYLDSPSRGMVIADEVGLGKTIEAGLIWTELRARQDARRLLVVCPAILRPKWVEELRNRFGVQAEVVAAGELHTRLQQAQQDPHEEFALIASLQGLRSPKNWDNEKNPSNSAAAKLARFLQDCAEDEPLLDLVVVDEAHYLRNPSTQSHRFARLLRPLTDGLVLMSATPIQTSSLDLFNLLHLLDADAFPNEWAYKWSLEANAPIVHLRDRVMREVVPHEEFVSAIEQAATSSRHEGVEQLKHLRENPPTPEMLASPQGRAQVADWLDRINPRSKVISRTLKRHVQEFRVEREPVTLRAHMSTAERAFYDAVTSAVRNKAERDGVGDGLLLTIPQRQMSSSMAAACARWLQHGQDQGWSADDVVDLIDDVIDEGVEVDKVAAFLDPSPFLPERAPAAHGQRGKSEFLNTLSAVAMAVGDLNALRAQDSKFNELIKNLKAYWREQPSGKVVLFAFFRYSLHYLHERLAEHGVKAAVLHGGMDKNKILKSFQSEDGAQILLSSEVASEGVDLQFSSLLINYDLPWNPARIEQRIGRIDRIGQQAKKILIWNLMYADSLDDRVYSRLLERLNIFKHALGSMEAILGEQVNRLTQDLLTHSLTPAQEAARIDEAALALENLRRQQDQLEAQATELVGHSDFILNKVKAANDLGRYIRGDDLLVFVRDYLEQQFPGSRFVGVEDKPMEFRIELSVDARVHFQAFLAEYKLAARTGMLRDSPPKLWFDNHVGTSPRGVEKITQDHPLVRFVVEQLRLRTKPAYYPTSALELAASQATGVSPGLYVFKVERWSMSGARDAERLVYQVRLLQGSIVLDGVNSESLVNAAALLGEDWHGQAKQMLDHDAVAIVEDDCRADLYDQYLAAKAAYERENLDRVTSMVGAIEMDERRRVMEMEERIARHRMTASHLEKGLKTGAFITMEQGKARKLKQRNAERIAALHLKEQGKFEPSAVASGVIKVT
jgi:superfamily II DNA or RNA helicase